MSARHLCTVVVKVQSIQNEFVRESNRPHSLWSKTLSAVFLVSFRLLTVRSTPVILVRLKLRSLEWTSWTEMKAIVLFADVVEKSVWVLSREMRGRPYNVWAVKSVDGKEIKVSCGFLRCLCRNAWLAFNNVTTRHSNTLCPSLWIIAPLNKILWRNSSTTSAHFLLQKCFRQE